MRAGLALGAFLGRTGVVSDMMIQACAEALPELITDEDLHTGYVFPRLSDARPALNPANAKTPFHNRTSNPAFAGNLNLASFLL